MAEPCKCCLRIGLQMVLVETRDKSSFKELIPKFELEDGFICKTCSDNLQYFVNFKYSIVREHEKLSKGFPDIEIKEEPVFDTQPMLAVFVDNSELSGAVKIDPSMLECQPDITEIDVSLKSEYHDYQPDFPLESKFDFIPMRNTSKNSSSLGSRRKVKNLRSNKSGSRLFQCQYCSHQANHRGNLGRHIKAIHPEAESESLRIEPIPQTSGWLYKCDFCSYENDVRTNLLRHLRLKHPKRIKQEDDNEKPSGRNRFECKDCEASFYTQNRLIKHQNREHQDKHEIICIYCQSVFSTVELMKEHCRHFHQKLGNSNRKKKKREYILCPVCGNLVQKGLMKVHIAGVHNKEKKYLCTDCGKDYIGATQLRDHRQIHHSNGLRPFHCDHCHNSFPTKKYVLRHIQRNHIKKELTIRCEFCLKGFFGKPDLNRHLRRMHHAGEEDDGMRADLKTNKFHCPFCSKKFQGKLICQQHINRHHR